MLKWAFYEAVNQGFCYTYRADSHWNRYTGYGAVAVKRIIALLGVLRGSC